MTYQTICAQQPEESDSGHCDKHGAFSRRVVALPFGGRRIQSGCPQCAAERQAQIDAEDAQQLASMRAATARHSMDRAGIPERFRSARFETYQAAEPRQQRALTIAQRYADGHRGGVLVLHGRPGTGKTHLACAVAAAFLARNEQPLFMAVKAAVRHVKDTYRRDSERSETQAIRDLTTPALLILDEIGVQLGTEHEMQILFEVINERYAAARPSILISNLDDASLRAFLGDRLMDRVRDGGAVVAFDWDSYRGKRAA